MARWTTEEIRALQGRQGQRVAGSYPSEASTSQQPVDQQRVTQIRSFANQACSRRSANRCRPISSLRGILDDRRNRVWSRYVEMFRRSGVEPPSATVLTVSLHLYMRLIETGHWLGLVPASVMRFGGKRMRLKILPVKTLSPPAPVGFVTVKSRTLTPLAERFIDCTRKVANSNAGSASMPRR